MSDIFGPDTRINRQERRVAERLVSGRDIAYPIFDGNKLISVYGDSVGGDVNNLGSDIFSSFEKGVIIPFDFIDIPRKDFLVPIANKRGIREYRSEYRKFIARPDFFYVGFEDGLAHIFPVDLKSSETKGINQISMFNTAMLYFHSNYMQKIVSYLKNNCDSKPVFENGFFLYEEEYQNSNKINLEKYIQDFLHTSVQRRDSEEENLGVSFVDGKPKLTINPESSFTTNNDFEFTPISESKLISYLAFIKGRLSGTTTYPNSVCSINGFNGGRKPIRRLDFHPSTHIKTYNPDIELIETEMQRIYEMSPCELFETYHLSNLSFDEGRLEKLEVELEAKERDRSFRVQKRIDENLGNSTNKSLKIFEVNIGRLEKRINAIEDEILKVKQEVLTDREMNHQIKPKKGSSLWYSKSVDIRDSLISKRVQELKKQKEKALLWMEKDIKLSKSISDFHLRCMLEEDFSLATEPYFSLPSELYLQFHSHKLMRVLSYNAFNLNK